MSSPVQTKLIANAGVDCDHFGRSHQIDHDTAIAFVGACGVNVGDRRSVWISVRDENATTSWSRQDKLVASDGGAGDRFGYSIDIYKDTSIVGA